MSSSRPGRWALDLLLVLLLVLLSGCAGAAATQPPPSGGVAPPPTATSTPPATAEPTQEPTPEPTLEPPPGATLVSGAAEAPGRIGSYVWAGGSDAAPWLPAGALEPVAVSPGGDARVTLDPAVAIEQWSARAARADDPGGTAITPLGSGTGAPAFGLPGRGAWVVAVSAVFAGGLGDATWYWHVIAE